MKVVMVEPGQYARITEIEDTLQAKQKAVGGLITAAYPWEELVCIVANDEGLLNGMPLNRNIEDYQAIAGPFFVCGLTEDDFCSLTDEQAERYQKMFLRPSLFVETTKGIMQADYDNPALPGAPEDVVRRYKVRGGMPDWCFCPLPSSKKLVVARYGAIGYLPIHLAQGGKNAAEQADRLNEALGVTKQQRGAMLGGALCGWNSPIADPKYYDEDGILKPKPQKEKQEVR